MRKFTVMILGVSIFFIGLGGIGKQFAAKFKSASYTFAFVRQDNPETGEEEITRPRVKSFTVVRSPEKDFIISGMKEEMKRVKPETDFQLPKQVGEVFEFRHQPGDDILRQNQELPRKADKNIIIVRRENTEKAE